MFSDYNDILCVADVCELLMIGRNRCYELLNNGSLKGFRVGKNTWRIPKKSLEMRIRPIQEKNLKSSPLTASISVVFT